MTLRERLPIRAGQTEHFYSMPRWWILLVLLSAVLTGLGIGQVQDALVPGAATLSAGVALAGLSVWLRRRAKARRR
jgi:hypothetical protein